MEKRMCQREQNPGCWCLYTLDRGECSYTSLGAEVLGKLLCAGSSLLLQLRTAMMHSICFPGLEDQLTMAGKW